MTTRVWIAGIPTPFHVKGEPSAVWEALVQHGEIISGQAHQQDSERSGDVELVRYAGFVQFEAVHSREPVYIAPNQVGAVTGPGPS